MAFIAKTQCFAFLDNGRQCQIVVRKSDAFHDVFDMYWCSEHQERGWLLNWAAKHQFPSIRFTDGVMEYAIGADNDPDLWKIPVMLGSQSMVHAAVVYVQSLEQDEDELYHAS